MSYSPDEVFQFERNIAQQAAGLLRAAGAGDASTVRGPMDSANFAEDAQGVELPRIGCECSTFVKASGQKAFTRQGVGFWNHFRGTLAIEMNTPRKGGAARHHAWLGLSRRLFCIAAAPEFRPYDLLTIEEGAGSFTLVKDGETDRSRLVFAMQIVIPTGIVDYSVALPLPAIAAA